MRSAGVSVRFHCPMPPLTLFQLAVAKGLSPLPDEDEVPAPSGEKQPSAKLKDTDKAKTQPLSFSSGGSTARISSKKRKAIGSVDDDKHEDASSSKKNKGSKKPKKSEKKLLSFGDDA